MIFSKFGVDIEVDLTDPNGQKKAHLRLDRNIKLMASDWIELPSCNLSETKKQEWMDYRQALRDLPSKVDFDLENYEIPWPEQPKK
jgi:Phage tail assembly chaperone protein